MTASFSEPALFAGILARKAPVAPLLHARRLTIDAFILTIG
jgi:hypothetical protein